jgi:hypothetical protein
MDPSALVNLMIATAGSKAVKAVGEASGQALFSAVRSKAETLLNIVRQHFKQQHNDEKLTILTRFEHDPQKEQLVMKEAIEEAISDVAIALKLKEQSREVRNALLKCLEEGLTLDDLDKLAFRLGFSSGQLYTDATPKGSRAIKILDVVEKQRRFPDLIDGMLEINPYLV